MGTQLSSEISGRLFDIVERGSENLQRIDFLYDIFHILYLRAEMPSKKPTPIMAAQREEPPYEMKYRGMPVIGIMPMAMPTFIMKWNMNMPKRPAPTSLE